MSLSLIIGCCWVLAAAVTAMLPMRRQLLPGLALILAAPVLIGAIGWDYGWIPAIAAFAAFVSMFRNPLKYLWKWAKGERPEIPK